MMLQLKFYNESLKILNPYHMKPSLWKEDEMANKQRRLSTQRGEKLLDWLYSVSCEVSSDINQCTIMIIASKPVTKTLVQMASIYQRNFVRESGLKMVCVCQEGG